MRFHDLVHLHYHEMSEAEIEISRYISENLEQIKEMSIKDFAHESLSSKSSVIRFSQKLGFTGFSELRNFLKWETSKDGFGMEQSFMEQSIVDTEKTIRYIQEADWSDIYKVIDACNRIFVISTGVTQKSQAAELQRLFLLIGKPVQVIPGNAQSNEFKRITENLTETDILFLLSLSGENENLEEILNVLKLKHSVVISVTNLRNNRLSGRADYNLYASSSRSPLPQDWWLQTASTFFLLIEAFAFGYVDHQRR